MAVKNRDRIKVGTQRARPRGGSQRECRLQRCSLGERYPQNWNEIAQAIKEKSGWRCTKCGLQCLRPSDDASQLSRSEKAARMLTVHHQNYIPEDNRLENLRALCSACHLAYHTRRRSNVSPGQLSLF
ncbi:MULTISPECIES: HNH endonuclease [Nostocales]|uniref:HNH endonuclease n=2 Tax=Nostocales TaxID=1161 RepID=A0ABW8WZL0_9CYAN